MDRQYDVVIERDEEGFYVASVPQLQDSRGAGGWVMPPRAGARQAIAPECSTVRSVPTPIPEWTR